jgi:hypothetical protein
MRVCRNVVGGITHAIAPGKDTLICFTSIPASCRTSRIWRGASWCRVRPMPPIAAATAGAGRWEAARRCRVSG